MCDIARTEQFPCAAAQTTMPPATWTIPMCWARAHLVAALGRLGDEKQAQSALDDLMKAKPEVSLEFAR